jgi:hypothetical protein
MVNFLFWGVRARFSLQSTPWLRTQQAKWHQYWARDERSSEVQEWIIKDRWTDI